MINFSTILTQEEISKLSLNKINIINNLGTYYASLIIQKFCLQPKDLVIPISMIEKNDWISKELLLANIIFSNDEEFINKLLSYGIKYNELLKYSKIITKLKKIVSIKNFSDLDPKTKFIILIINELCSIFNAQENLTIAKIHEIALFKSDLYHEMEKQKMLH